MISRRGFLRAAALTSAALATACTPAPATPTPLSTSTPAPPTPGPARGGTLRVATIGELPSIDPHWTTATVTANAVWHVVEALFTLDARFQTVPLLAESLETSGDGLTRTLKLRKGVLFHNNREMVADDVEASLLRWSQISGLGKGLFARVDGVTKPDKYTLVFTLKSPYSIFDVVLGFRAGGAAIMPKEVVEAAGATSEVSQLIGTGPYRFVEQLKDRLVRLARWERYVSLGDSANGAGGRKNAYFDEIRFVPQPDQAARVRGLQAGDFDFADGFTADQYARFKDDRQLAALIGPPAKTPLHYFNLESRITSDRKLRQAIMVAIDDEAALKAGWGAAEFYRTSGALMQQESIWHTEAGARGIYNQKNLDRAKELLNDSRYDGETIRYLTTREYPTMYREAEVIGQQLRALGIKVDLQVVDWGTLVTRRSMAEQWEIFTTWHGFAQDPCLMDWFSPTYPGWWTGEKIDALRDEMLATTGPSARFAVFERLQTQFYDDVPLLKLGDVRDLYLTNPRLKDVGTLPYTTFWNAYLTR